MNRKSVQMKSIFFYWILYFVKTDGMEREPSGYAAGTFFVIVYKENYKKKSENYDIT